MSRFARTFFGGGSRFGGDPYGLDVRFIVDRMIASLERFKYNGATDTGVLKTLGVLTAPLNDREALAHMLQAGTPAMLCGYLGGKFGPSRTTGGNVFTQDVTFVVVCIASEMRTREDRVGSRRYYEPGLWNLTRWAAFYVGRELVKSKMLERAQPAETSFAAYEALGFVGIVKFEGEVTLDVYDDVLATKLEKLGICHSPKDLSQLFIGDTPQSDEPATLAGGVSLLKEVADDG